MPPQRRRWIVLALVSLALLAGLWWSLPRRAAPAARSAATRERPDPAPRGTTPPLRLSSANATPIESPADGSGCLVEGRVVSTRSGAGVPRASLTFGRDGAVFAVESADDGSFRWLPEAGTYQLTATTAPGFLSFSPALGHSPVELRARRGVHLRGITIFLTPAVEYAGLVVDDKRRPIAGAQIKRLEPLEGEPGELTADAAGAFTFHAPDDATFEANSPGHRARIAQVDLAVQVSRRLVFQLGARDADEPSPRPTAGVVLDDRRAPLENALVTVFERDVALARTTTEGDGRFAFALRAPTARVVATYPGLVPAELPAVAAGATDLVLQLRRGGRISGAVRERESGRPVVAFSVLATRRRGALERGESVTASFFDPEGAYQLSGLPAGSYQVVAVAQGRAAAPEQTVDISDGADGRADFTLARGARLTGRVIDGVTGAGIAQARVALENHFGASTDVPLPVIASTETSASGEFELSGLGVGSCSLFAAAAGHHSRVLPGIAILADGTPPLTIDLTPTKPGEEPLIESAGINAAVSAVGDQLVLGRVSPNGGAAAAGLVAGDIILQVDGADVRDLGFIGAVEHMRGPEGSTVVLTIRRGDAESAVPVIRRRVINR